MSRRILLVPSDHAVGMSSVSLGLLQALDEHGFTFGYVKPLAQPRKRHEDHTTALVRLATSLHPPEPIPVEDMEHELAHGTIDSLMERVLHVCDQVSADNDVVVIEGLVPTEGQTYSVRVNRALAQTLDAEVVLVGTGADKSPDAVAGQMAEAEPMYRVGEGRRVVGGVVNFLPKHIEGRRPEDYRAALAEHGIPLVGAIVSNRRLMWPRVADLVRELDLKVLREGDQSRRIREVSIAAQTVPGVLSGMDDGVLLLVPGDRNDVLMSAALRALAGVRLAAMLFTRNVPPDDIVLDLCDAGFGTGLPLLISADNTFDTASHVMSMDHEIPVDDEVRVNMVMQDIADGFDDDWLDTLGAGSHRQRLSPAAFRRELTRKAQAAHKRIVLPEGAEPRTVQAAITCQEKSIADCVLLAPREEVEAAARSLGVAIPEGLEIIDPTNVDEKYVTALVERRKHKGMTEPMAREHLCDTVVLGTMMVYLGEVDGLVSGAVHTTANTVRPALQILGTKPGAKLVSSVFFMGLPDEVVIYGDCAINPDPNAEELADIAIQSAESALAFGIEPRIAMISFSTGSSGSGADVDKVTEATRIVKEQRPDLIVDGPLQYDAATTMSVAKSKAPDSPVAGRATVFVFPDLNTGNTTYKAVQRSASVISVGPMLQGIAAPVNDLSRGALIEDIVYTIALTAIQAAAD